MKKLWSKFWKGNKSLLTNFIFPLAVIVIGSYLSWHDSSQPVSSKSVTVNAKGANQPKVIQQQTENGNNEIVEGNKYGNDTAGRDMYKAEHDQIITHNEK